MTGEHEALVIELVGRRGFVSSCLCGWMTDGHPTHAAAFDDWETHCDVVSRDGCGEQGEL